MTRVHGARVNAGWRKKSGRWRRLASHAEQKNIAFICFCGACFFSRAPHQYQHRCRPAQARTSTPGTRQAQLGEKTTSAQTPAQKRARATRRAAARPEKTRPRGRSAARPAGLAAAAPAPERREHRQQNKPISRHADPLHKTRAFWHTIPYSFALPPTLLCARVPIHSFIQPSSRPAGHPASHTFIIC